MKQNQELASDAIEQAWRLTWRVRALCPRFHARNVGLMDFQAPDWYVERGASSSVNLGKPLTDGDIVEANEIGAFINRQFVITLASILEVHKVSTSKPKKSQQNNGWKYAKFTKDLRDIFAHGRRQYDNSKEKERTIKRTFGDLFPGIDPVDENGDCALSIDLVLEPLKNHLLTYIQRLNDGRGVERES